MTMPNQKPPTRWDTVQLEYRAGLKPLRVIAKQQATTHVSILRRARREEWTRDLSAKITAREDAIVTKALSCTTDRTNGVARTNLVAENHFVQAAAGTKAAIRLEQAERFRQQFEVLDVMLGEIALVSNPKGVGLIELLMDVMRKPQHEETDEEMLARRKKQVDLMERIVGLPDRVEVFNKLTQSTERLSRLQREAYGIGDKESVDPAPRTLTDLERAHRLSAWLERVQTRIANEATDAAAIVDAHVLPAELPTSTAVQRHEEAK